MGGSHHMGAGMRQPTRNFLFPAILFFMIQACGSGGLGGGAPVGPIDTGGASGVTPGGAALDNLSSTGAGSGGSNTTTSVAAAQPFQSGAADEGGNPTGSFFNIPSSKISLNCRSETDDNLEFNFQGEVFPPAGLFNVFQDGIILRTVNVAESKFHDELLKAESLFVNPGYGGKPLEYQIGKYDFSLMITSTKDLKFYLLPAGSQGDFGSGFKACPSEGCYPPKTAMEVLVDLGFRATANEIAALPSCSDLKQHAPLPIQNLF